MPHVTRTERYIASVTYSMLLLLPHASRYMNRWLHSVSHQQHVDILPRIALLTGET